MNDNNRNKIIRNIYTDKGGEDDVYLGDIDDIKEINDNKEYFANLKKTNKQQFFKYYCQLYTELSKEGKITRQTAAHVIAGWMFDNELRSIPAINEIVFLAGRLELPYQHATDVGDKNAYDIEWNALIEKIRDLEF